MNVNSIANNYRFAPIRGGRRFIRLASSGAAIVLALLALGVDASAQEAITPPAPGAGAKVSPEWIRFREALKKAKPIPEPKHEMRPQEFMPSGDLVRFDLVSGEVSKFPTAKINAKSQAVMRNEGHPGAMPISADGKPHVILGEGPESLGVVDKGPAPQNITPTPPTPMKEPYVFKPYRTHFKLLMRFKVPNDFDRFFVCSASSTSSFHLLTAAHCIYNHDPFGDGSKRGAGYAAEVWAWPSQTDVVDPLGWTDFPWGVAKVTRTFAYESWVISQNFDFDFAVLTLDRRIGDRIGWMPRETGVYATTLHYSGYPVEEPYVPFDTPFQYPGGNNGNVNFYASNRISLAAYTYGGHSGGAAFRCCIGSEYIFQGVSSTSNRIGTAFYTWFTPQMNLDLINIISTDVAQRPPVNRAQLIEYVFDNYSKGLGVLSVSPGDLFDVVLNAFNAGYAPSGAVTADIYLSKTFNLDGATYVGTVPVINNLEPNNHTIQYKQLRMPTSIQPGNYFVGWNLRGTNPQYDTDNTTALMTKRQLRVVGLSTVGANVSSVTGGTTATGTVYLTGPAPQIGLGDGTDVLLSSNRAAAKPANSVHFNVDQTTATFNITTTPVAQNTTAVITANLNGVTRTTSILIKPAGLTLLTVAPTSVVGGTTSSATITFNGPAPTGGIAIKLSSSNGKAVVPSTVRVNAGSTSATFTVKTSSVTAPITATIKATYSGISKTATLSIKPK